MGIHWLPPNSKQVHTFLSHQGILLGTHARSQGYNWRSLKGTSSRYRRGCIQHAVNYQKRCLAHPSDFQGLFQSSPLLWKQTPSPWHDYIHYHRWFLLLTLKADCKRHRCLTQSGIGSSPGVSPCHHPNPSGKVKLTCSILKVLSPGIRVTSW